MSVAMLVVIFMTIFAFHRRRILPLIWVGTLLLSPYTANALVVSDVSTTGSIPDANNDGVSNQQGDNIPTAITFTSNAAVATSQFSSPVRRAENGWLEVTLSVVVKNIGDVGLFDLKIEGPLARQLPEGAKFIVTDIEASSDNLVINPLFDGRTERLLLSSDSKLPALASETIRYVLQFDPTTVASPLNLQANVLASGPHNRTWDQSHDGKEPDPDNDKNGMEDDENGPTQIVFDEQGCEINGSLLNQRDGEGALPPLPLCVALYDSHKQLVAGAPVERNAFAVATAAPGVHSLELGEIRDGQCHVGELPNGWRVASDPVLTVRAGKGEECLNGQDALAFTLSNGITVAGTVYAENGRQNLADFDGQHQTHELGLSGVRVTASCDQRTCATATTNARGRFVLDIANDDLPSTKTVVVRTVDRRGYSTLPVTHVKPAAQLVDARANETRIAVGNTDVDMHIPLVADNVLLKDTVVRGECGERYDLGHIYNARAPGEVSFTFSPSGRSVGWRYFLYRDTNCDGQHQALEPEIRRAIALDVNDATQAPEQVCALLSVVTPECPGGQLDHRVTLKAEYQYKDTRVAATTSVVDRLILEAPQAGEPDIRLSKSVRNVTRGTDGSKALPCEVLEYQINYINRGQGAAKNFVIRDVVGHWSLLHAAPVCGPQNDGCVADIEAGKVGEKAELRWRIRQRIKPEATGYVRYRVHVGSNKACEYKADGITLREK